MARTTAKAPVRKKDHATRKRSEAEKAHEDPYKAKNPAEFVRQSAGELKKVVWPTWPETVKMYSAVLVFVLIMIAIVGLLDLAFGWGLLKIFGS
ncbi:MAG: preprotein translocase subunit SecE [Propionibacteriaceae bacterium]|nr:preprotein translocase subunit SecE [Propionibacteriaceae bacterium]